MPHSAQRHLCLFSASKDQRRYFDRLSHHLSRELNVTSWWYKDLPEVASVPIANADDLVAPIVAQWLRRNQSTRVGRRKPGWWWRLAALWQGWQAVRLLRKYTGLLSNNDCSHVGVWNGKKFRQALFVIAAKQLGKSVLFFEIGPLPGYSMVDSQGVNAFSSIPKSADFYQVWAQRHLLMAQTIPVQTKQQVFIPFQVVEDSNIYLHSPWIQDMHHLFNEVKALARSYPTIQFVFKQHPKCSEKYDDLMATCLPNMRFENTLPSTKLIAESQAVITINSTVGMEALLQHKPLLVLGEALYDFAPLTLPVRDSLAFHSAFAQVLDGWRAPALLTKAFVHYLETEYAVPGDAMKSADESHFDAMTRKVLSLI